MREWRVELVFENGIEFGAFKMKNVSDAFIIGDAVQDENKRTLVA